MLYECAFYTVISLQARIAPIDIICFMSNININYDQDRIVVLVAIARSTLFTSSWSVDNPQAESMHLVLVRPHNIGKNGQSAYRKTWRAAQKAFAHWQVLPFHIGRGHVGFVNLPASTPTSTFILADCFIVVL